MYFIIGIKVFFILIKVMGFNLDKEVLKGEIISMLELRKWKEIKEYLNKFSRIKMIKEILNVRLVNLSIG